MPDKKLKKPWKDLAWLIFWVASFASSGVDMLAGNPGATKILDYARKNMPVVTRVQSPNSDEIIYERRLAFDYLVEPNKQPNYLNGLCLAVSALLGTDRYLRYRKHSKINAKER